MIECTCGEEWNGPTLNGHEPGCPWAAVDEADKWQMDHERVACRAREALEDGRADLRSGVSAETVLERLLDAVDRLIEELET